MTGRGELLYCGDRPTGAGFTNREDDMPPYANLVKIENGHLVLSDGRTLYAGELAFILREAATIDLPNDQINDDLQWGAGALERLADLEHGVPSGK